MSTDLTYDRHFLAAWLRNPAQAGALWPSGQALARAMAAHVDPHRPDPVVELGAGTGAITRALLARGVAPQRLVAVEKDPALCRVLRFRFPGLAVLQGDAAELAALLAEAGAVCVGTVVSGLPLLGMASRARRRALEQVAACLGPDGAFVQFTYAPFAPVPRAAYAALGWSGRRVVRVPWNLPPAAVWVYTRRAEA